MDSPKEGRVRGHGIYRGERVNFIRISFNYNRNRSTSTGNHKKEMRLSPQSQGKQLTPYATMILSTTFRKTISKGPIYNQESKRNEDN